VEQKAAQGGAQERADDGHRGKPGKQFSLSGPRDIRHHRHGHRAVNGGGQAMEEANDYEPVIFSNNQVGEGHYGKDR
jgi:hypothetical protein